MLSSAIRSTRSALSSASLSAIAVLARASVRGALATALCAGAVSAQDLYDTTVLRTINLQFHDANWWTLLQQNYTPQTNILADLTMDGVTYPSVGVRIRGNTSYTGLPPGSQKVSLNVDMDQVNPAQSLLGYNSLNLNNAFRDPTFCREVAYNNFVARFMPNARANHVVVTLNGANWGVYANVQQYNKDLLRNWFPDEDGLRIKCANNPNGPGLRYVGTNPALYSGYEVKDDGGLADPIGALIDVCASVTNEPLATWQNIDSYLAIDPSTWSVVMENLLTDDDSYVNKGADFMLYRDPTDGRTHLHQTDANETFTAATWAVTRNFTATTKPVLSHVLAVPELRQRYMAHYRRAMQDVTWAAFDAEFTAYRNLISAAVQADPKKIYTYQQFLDNFTVTVNLGSGGFGGNLIGLQQFFTQRLSTLNATAELVAQGPSIANVQHSPANPAPTDVVRVTASVAATTSAVAAVELFYRPAPGSYLRVAMLDNGLSGDGAAGDGVYGAVLPVSAAAGQAVPYYVGARAANAFGSLTFSPARTEIAPNVVDYSFGGAGVRVTEYMYSGANGEFVELTNLSGAPVDLTGWSLDDDSGVAGTFSLSGAGVLAPGASVLVTDAAPAAFATAWGLTGANILGPNTVAALGRNDQINVYDANGDLVERLTYGDESFPGSIRTQTKSGQVCNDAIGLDDPFSWTLAIVGDAWGSVASTGGDLGRPGVHTSLSCTAPIGLNYCIAGVNNSGTNALITAVGSAAVSNQNVTLNVAGGNPNASVLFLLGDAQLLTPFGNGYRCVGGNVRRIAPITTFGATGTVSRTLDFNAGYASAIVAGAGLNFQVWYRDAGSFNLSDAVHIDFH